MREITSRLARQWAELDITVIGTTHDEPALMRAGAFVTGAVSAAELSRLFERYRLDRLIICLAQPLFGHPAVESSMTAAIPIAYLDWSDGRLPPRKGDLALGPSVSPEEMIGALVPWLGRRAVP